MSDCKLNALEDQEELLKAGKIAMDYVSETDPPLRPPEREDQDRKCERIGAITGFLLWYWKQQNENKP